MLHKMGGNCVGRIKIYLWAWNSILPNRGRSTYGNMGSWKCNLIIVTDHNLLLRMYRDQEHRTVQKTKTTIFRLEFKTQGCNLHVFGIWRGLQPFIITFQSSLEQPLHLISSLNPVTDILTWEIGGFELESTITFVLITISFERIPSNLGGLNRKRSLFFLGRLFLYGFCYVCVIFWQQF